MSKKTKVRKRVNTNSFIKKKDELEIESPVLNSRDYFNREYFAKFGKVPLVDLTSNKTKTVSLSKYTKDQIMTWLKAPESNAKSLREVSTYLYVVSSQYRRLVNYFAKMYKFDYILIPYKSDFTSAKSKSILDAYKRTVEYVETMNLKHEMQKASVVAWREDVFYGYIYKTNNSFTLKKLFVL